MDRYRHNVSGFFAQRAPAEDTRSQLIQRGLQIDQLRIFASNGTPAAGSRPRWENRQELKDMLVDGAIGAGIGIGIGTLLQLAILASDMEFPLSTVQAPFMLIAWGALLGGFFGTIAHASRDTHHRTGRLSRQASAADSQADVVLVAETHSAQETAIAHEVIKASADLCKDLDMVVTPRQGAAR
ncbi:hypothetical protein ABS648_13420 [Pseudomonas solani]|uniref:DUF1269 domain-containing protein n=1 Tax=Pseudomonas solani TaxID=2731552 RepID=A0AAU7YAF4_9PSED